MFSTRSPFVLSNSENYLVLIEWHLVPKLSSPLRVNVPQAKAFDLRMVRIRLCWFCRILSEEVKPENSVKFSSC
ncbi:hypothetical protein GCK32_013003 [Trichostrongylus colubriformis]|uniref:Uncharacterized protein n=1 Tax=Trichostrongylus colubriformis TaxID=6319 RepID=A0AAN8FYT1_TRICO